MCGAYRQYTTACLTPLLRDGHTETIRPVNCSDSHGLHIFIAQLTLFQTQPAALTFTHNSNTTGRESDAVF